MSGIISATDTSDKTGSAKTSTNKSVKKRKSPVAPGETEQSKTKRQRKSTKNKNASDITIQDIASSDVPLASQLPQQERLAMKSVSPGKGVSFAISSGDRNVTPVKTSDEHFILSQYQPRSITKGIGFVPISTVPPVGSTVTMPSVITTTANHSLDVLATISASLRTSNFVQDMQEPAARNLIHSFTGKNPLPADGNRQLSDDSRIMIDGNRQQTKGNQKHSNNSAATTLNGNQLPAEENQRNKPTEAARLDSDSIPISADSVKTAKVGFSEGRQKAWDGYKQSPTERFFKENQREISVVSLVSKNAPVEDTLERQGNDKADSITGKDQDASELSKKIENKTVNSNSVVLDDSANKAKKPKKSRQKKTKIDKPNLDSKDGTTSKTKDCTPSGVKQDISLENDSGNKTEPLRQLSSNHDVESKVKQTSPMPDAFYLSGHNNSDNSSVLKSTDIEIKERVELSKLLSSKPVVSDCLENLDISKQSREEVLQESSKPLDRTIVSQNIQSLNFGYDKILASNMSNNENLTPKGKEKNKEASTGKKTAKKESKNKPEGSKTKKPSEKKQKTPRSNVQEKDTVSKSAKKSSKGTADKALIKTKKQPNQYSDKLSSLASQISLDNEETSILNLLAAPSALFTKSNVCDNEVKSLEQVAVIANESEKSDDAVMEKKPGKLENSIKDSRSILKELLSSEGGTMRSMGTSTPVENTPKGAEKIGEIPKKKKSKGSTSEAQNEISANDKIKKKTFKDEKSSKNNKKPRKKSEKTSVKAVESITEDSSRMVVDEMPRSVGDEGKLNRNKEPGEETISVTSEPMTTDVDVNVSEKQQDREDIVFVNDLSVGDFVKARENEEGSVFSESSLYRKRKRCASPSMNDPVVSESNGKLLLNF